MGFLGFIFLISRKCLKSGGSSMLGPPQSKTVFYITASVTSCLLEKHFIRAPSARTLHRVPPGNCPSCYSLTHPQCGTWPLQMKTQSGGFQQRPHGKLGSGVRITRAIPPPKHSPKTLIFTCSATRHSLLSYRAAFPASRRVSFLF